MRHYYHPSPAPVLPSKRCLIKSKMLFHFLLLKVEAGDKNRNFEMLDDKTTLHYLRTFSQLAVWTRPRKLSLEG